MAVLGFAQTSNTLAARWADEIAIERKRQSYKWAPHSNRATIAFWSATAALVVAVPLAIPNPFYSKPDSEQQIQTIIAQSGIVNEKVLEIYNAAKTRAILAADATLPTKFEIKLPDCSTDPVEGAFCELNRQNQTEIKQAFLNQKAAFDAKMDAAALCLTQQTMGVATVCEMTEAQFNQMQASTVYVETTTIDLEQAVECLTAKASGKRIKCEITQSQYDHMAADGKITQDEITTSTSIIRPFDFAALEASGAKILKGLSIETAETLRPSVTEEAKAFEQAAKPVKKAKTVKKAAKVPHPMDLGI